MHFSRPSGQRLSWWWPWNRGAVGRLSSGYCTVSTFLNISRKVTPKPLTGLRKSGPGNLLRHARGLVVSGDAAVRDAVVVRQVERRHREAGPRPGGLLQPDQLAVLVVVPLVLVARGQLGTERRQPLGVLLVALVPEGDQQDEQDEDHARDRVDDRGVVVRPQRPDGGDQ